MTPALLLPSYCQAAVHYVEPTTVQTNDREALLEQWR
jgi:hypothetical protein